MKRGTAHADLCSEVVDTHRPCEVTLQPIDCPRYLTILTPRRRNLAQTRTEDLCDTIVARLITERDPRADFITNVIGPQPGFLSVVSMVRMEGLPTSTGFPNTSSILFSPSKSRLFTRDLLSVRDSGEILLVQWPNKGGRSLLIMIFSSHFHHVPLQTSSKKLAIRPLKPVVWSLAINLLLKNINILPIRIRFIFF